MLPRRQDLPDDARVSLDGLRTVLDEVSKDAFASLVATADSAMETSKQPATQAEATTPVTIGAPACETDASSECMRFPPLLVVSWAWWSAEHPDSRGVQLRFLANVLEWYMCERRQMHGNDAIPPAVYIDFASLHHPPPVMSIPPQNVSAGEGHDDEPSSNATARIDHRRRTANERAAYHRAIASLDLLYAHAGTVKLLLTNVPDARRRHRSTTRVVGPPTSDDLALSCRLRFTCLIWAASLRVQSLQSTFTISELDGYMISRAVVECHRARQLALSAGFPITRWPRGSLASPLCSGSRRIG